MMHTCTKCPAKYDGVRHLACAAPMTRFSWPLSVCLSNHSCHSKSETPQSRHLLVNIRKCNSYFQMTGVGTSKDVTERDYMPIFKVQGQSTTSSVASSRCPRKSPSFCRSTSSPIQNCRQHTDNRSILEQELTSSDLSNTCCMMAIILLAVSSMPSRTPPLRFSML